MTSRLVLNLYQFAEQDAYISAPTGQRSRLSVSMHFVHPRVNSSTDADEVQSTTQFTDNSSRVAHAANYFVES